ncbi:uncharacterized protein LOC127846703 isoform X2 [Dreissena polymorpha]|uniref:uncharacterized protein LOC127846703 isoform X2 n=1 Tax=Dreissena polymorpha TaxID=45954 RepID=UPI0022645CD3|nr:uncharacterized protein LOC127846703 isoform X2 [Dreissena polymorpha]
MAKANCDDITAYKQLSSPMYTSPKSITQIVSALSSYFEKQQLDKIRTSDYVALLADESTDEAGRSQLAILIRYLDCGNVEDHFVGLVNVKRRDAKTLTQALVNFLESKDININKVMFLGFDGCNTMSGEQNGVQRRFRNMVPHSQYINCRNHKLALCVKHLMKHFEVLVEVDYVLLSVYKLFEYSPQKFAVFKDVQSSYDVKELVMVRAAATRWLSHGVACRRFIDRFVQILDTLDELLERKGDSEIVAIRDKITSKNTVAAIPVMCDMLQPVNIFCKFLQGSAIDFSDVTRKLKELTDNLEILTQRFRACLQPPGVEDDLYLSRMSTLFAEIDQRTVYSRRLRDKDSYTPTQVVEELAIPMVNKLLEELDSGFNFVSPELKAFSVFTLTNLPETIVELRESDYGKKQQSTCGLAAEDAGG